MGAASIRHSPCPLFKEGMSSSTTRTQNAPREGGITRAAGTARLPARQYSIRQTGARNATNLQSRSARVQRPVGMRRMTMKSLRRGHLLTTLAFEWGVFCKEG